jgi:hypothetical protein
MSLIGTLEDVRIADVLRVLGSGRKSGVLTVMDEGRQVLLRFHRGAVVHASAGRLIGDEAVVDLFGWKRGQLVFVPEERNVPPNVTRDVEALIVEGLRAGDAFHRMNELVSSDHVVFRLGAGPADPSLRHPMGAAEWQVVRLLDGVRGVGEVVEHTGMPRTEIVRILFELTEAGFLERVSRERGRERGQNVTPRPER